MKRFLFSVVLWLFLSLLVIPSLGFAQDGSTITGVQFTPMSNINLYGGQTVMLRAWALGTGNYDPSVTYSLSDYLGDNAPTALSIPMVITQLPIPFKQERSSRLQQLACRIQRRRHQSIFACSPVRRSCNLRVLLSLMQREQDGSYHEEVPLW